MAVLLGVIIIKITSNTWKALITVVTTTKNNVGVTNGNVMLKNCWIGLAPSISAAA